MDRDRWQRLPRFVQPSNAASHVLTMCIEASSSSPPKTEMLRTTNSLAPRTPHRIPLDAIHSAPQLGPGEEIQVPFILHAARHGEQDLCMLFVFREVSQLSVRPSSTILIGEYRRPQTRRSILPGSLGDTKSSPSSISPPLHVRARRPTRRTSSM